MTSARRARAQRKAGLRHHHAPRHGSSAREATGKHTVPDRKGQRISADAIIARLIGK